MLAVAFDTVCTSGAVAVEAAEEGGVVGAAGPEAIGLETVGVVVCVVVCGAVAVGVVVCVVVACGAVVFGAVTDGVVACGAVVFGAVTDGVVVCVVVVCVVVACGAVVFGAVTDGVVASGVVVVFGTAEETVLAGASEADWAVLTTVRAADEPATPVAPAAVMTPSARAFDVARGPQSATTTRATVAVTRPTAPRYKPQVPVDSARTNRCLPTSNFPESLTYRVRTIANLNCRNRRWPSA